MADPPPIPPSLREGLRPARLIALGEVASTSTYAIELRRRGELAAPAVVLADRQTAGRGRGGNAWVSPAGSLAVSFCTPASTVVTGQLSLVVGVAVRRAIATHGVEVMLKWPNDLLTRDGRKIGGILCERIDGMDIIGVGLNVTTDPAALPPTAASLLELGPAWNVHAACLAIWQSLWPLLRSLDETTFAGLAGEFERHHYLTGRQARVNDRAGRCNGIDARGRLLIDGVGIDQGHVEVLG